MAQSPSSTHIHQQWTKGNSATEDNGSRQQCCWRRRALGEGGTPKLLQQVGFGVGNDQRFAKATYGTTVCKFFVGVDALYE